MGLDLAGGKGCEFEEGSDRQRAVLQTEVSDSKRESEAVDMTVELDTRRLSRWFAERRTLLGAQDQRTLQEYVCEMAEHLQLLNAVGRY